MNPKLFCIFQLFKLTTIRFETLSFKLGKHLYIIFQDPIFFSMQYNRSLSINILLRIITKSLLSFISNISFIIWILFFINWSTFQLKNIGQLFNLWIALKHWRSIEHFINDDSSRPVINQECVLICVKHNLRSSIPQCHYFFGHLADRVVELSCETEIWDNNGHIGNIIFEFYLISILYFLWFF